MTKQTITRAETTICRYDLDGSTMAELRELFDGYAKQYGEEATLDICIYGDGDSDITIESRRLETDDEYAARMARAAAQAATQEQKDRAQLAALMAKYGNA